MKQTLIIILILGALVLPVFLICEYWLLSILILFISLLFIIIRKLLFKKQIGKYTKWIIIGCISSVFLSFIKPINNIPTVIENNNVYSLYHSDQCDRKNIKIFFSQYRNKLNERDKIRLSIIKSYIQNASDIDPLNSYYIAMILHHSNNSDDFLLANEYAKKAAAGKIQNAEWLVKASYDRYLLSIGEEQRYGTQKQFK